jgi:hypothetical protein
MAQTTIIDINIDPDDLAGLLALYDRIEVHRSTTGSGGPYVEISDAAGPTAAIIDGSVAGPWDLDGEELDILIDGEPESITVTFDGGATLSLAEVLTQINAVRPGLASEVPTATNRVRLVSSLFGTESSLVITAGTAATALGLSTTRIVGKERRIRLSESTTIYRFYDEDGDNSYWYRYRFSHSVSLQESSFSTPQHGQTEVVVPSAQQIQATAALVDGEGKPVVDKRVVFVLVGQVQVATTNYWAVPGISSRIEVLTDDTGHIQVNLLRGATYRVFFEGTPITREFVVPTTGSSFDLFSIIGTAPDPFDIAQVPARPIKVTI